MELVARSLLDPGDAVVVESPTYLGAIMAFRGYEADLHAVPMDDDGLCVDVLADRLRAGLRPKLVYVIPEHQNPTGLTLSVERRQALVELARAYGFCILEDVAYREIDYDGAVLPSLWSLAPELVVQAGTFSKVFFPGVRLGWAAGPAELVAQLGVAKQNTDQCAGAFGQRLVEEYGRAGHFGPQLRKARALYAGRWALMDRALHEHMPPGCEWTRPRGGFFTWLRLPWAVDTTDARCRGHRGAGRLRRRAAVLHRRAGQQRDAARLLADAGGHGRRGRAPAGRRGGYGGPVRRAALSATWTASRSVPDLRSIARSSSILCSR